MSDTPRIDEAERLLDRDDLRDVYESMREIERGNIAMRQACGALVAGLQIGGMTTAELMGRIKAAAKALAK